MKCILLNSTDFEGGAARAAFRLHKAFQRIDVDSIMLVGIRFSDDNNTIVSFDRWPLGISLIRQKLDALPLQFYRKRISNAFAPAIIPDNLNQKISALKPDVVHVHWIADGFLRIESLSKFKKPIVWTLHDMWAFTGGCYYDSGCGQYQNECGSCPILGSDKQDDLSHKVWKRKMRAWQGVDMTVVAPSRWLADNARRSSLFQDIRIEVIPYGLDLEIYKPSDKKFARSTWNLPKDKKLILFGAMSATNDRRKGFHLLSAALKKLSQKNLQEKAELVVFGASKPSESLDLGLKIHYMGQLHDDVSLALLYAAADLFVAPSIQDNLPLTIMESLACGTPVVAFSAGGIPEMVEHRVNGYLAEPNDSDDLACGMEWILENDENARHLGASARKKAIKEYSLQMQAERYLVLYNDILKMG